MNTTSRRRVRPTPIRTWLSIRVELVEGRGDHYWPRPGRLFAAARNHSYAQLATAIDEAFARWDRSHLHEFELTDGTRIGTSNPESDNEGVLDETRENLSRLHTFDVSIDPRGALGLVPNAPLPYFGWGNSPDQYGRAWADDDAESPTLLDPELTDLPPLRPGWGPKS